MKTKGLPRHGTGHSMRTKHKGKCVCVYSTIDSRHAPLQHSAVLAMQLVSTNSS